MTISPFELWSFCNHFFARINAAEIQKGEELCCILHCYYEADNNKIVSTENLTDTQLWAKVKEEFELSEKLKNKTKHLRKEFSVKYEALKQNKGRCSANPIVLSNRSFEPAKNEVNPKKTVDVQEIYRILKQDFDRQDEAFEKKRKEEAKKQQEFERKLQLAQQSGDLRAIIEAYRSDPAIDYLKNALKEEDNETSGGMFELRESDFPKGHWKEKYDYKLKEHKFPGKLYSFEYPGGKESFTAIVLDTSIDTSGHSGIKMDALVSLRADGKVTRLTDVF